MTRDRSTKHTNGTKIEAAKTSQPSALNLRPARPCHLSPACRGVAQRRLVAPAACGVRSSRIPRTSATGPRPAFAPFCSGIMRRRARSDAPYLSRGSRISRFLSLFLRSLGSVRFNPGRLEVASDGWRGQARGRRWEIEDGRWQVALGKSPKVKVPVLFQPSALISISDPDSNRG